MARRSRKAKRRTLREPKPRSPDATRRNKGAPARSYAATRGLRQNAPLVATLIDPVGTVAVERVAKSFGMSKVQLAETVGLKGQALYKPSRIRAPKTQSRVKEMLEIISLISEWAGGKDQAMAWYRAHRIPAFGGRTAEALVKSGVVLQADVRRRCRHRRRALQPEGDGSALSRFDDRVRNQGDQPGICVQDQSLRPLLLRRRLRRHRGLADGCQPDPAWRYSRGPELSLGRRSRGWQGPAVLRCCSTAHCQRSGRHPGAQFCAHSNSGGSGSRFVALQRRPAASGQGLRPERPASEKSAFLGLDRAHQCKF